jgi:hypothetical protein
MIAFIMPTDFIEGDRLERKRAPVSGIQHLCTLCLGYSSHQRSLVGCR